MNIDYTVGEVELTYKPKFKTCIKLSVLRMLINTCFLHIRKVQSVTKNISKSCF